mgnify:CR=1 FL=1
MRSLLNLLVAIAAIVLVACGHEPNIPSVREFVPAESDSVSFLTQGKISLEFPLEVVSVNAYVVNDDLKISDTLSVIFRKSSSGRYGFTAKKYRGEHSILQVDYSCIGKDSTTVLNLTEYMDMSVDSIPNLSLHGALISNRVRKFVQEDSYDLNLAKLHAFRELRTLWTVEKQDEKLLYWLPYVYGMEASSDEELFSLVNKFAESLGSTTKWDDLVNPVFVADSLVKISASSSVLGYDENFRFYRNLWKVAYGFSKCDSNTVGKLIQNQAKDSYFYKENFECVKDTLSKIPEEDRYFWKLKEIEIPQSEKDSSASDSTGNIDKDSTFVEFPLSYRDSAFGKCTAERKGEKERLNFGYYICSDSGWISIDRISYFLGICDRSKYVDVPPYVSYGQIFKNDSVGYYLCYKDEWTKSIAPVFHHEECKENRVVNIDNVYYACHDKNWNYATPEDLDGRLLGDEFCDNTQKGRHIKISDTQYYRCYEDKWKLENYTEEQVIIHELAKKYGLDEHYCDSANLGAAPVWLPKESVFLSCGSDYNFFDFVTVKPDSILEESVMETGKLGRSGYDMYLIVENNGIRYEFSQGNIYRLKSLKMDSIPYKVAYLNERYFATNETGGNYTSLDGVKEKSESFETFYEKWIDEVAENFRCYPWIDPKCSEPKEKAAIKNIRLNAAYEQAYVNWEKASKMCPPGFHIPSADEWMTPNFYTQNQYYPVDHPVDVGNSVYYDIFWTSDELDEETQYCYEQAWFRQSTITTAGNMVESRIIECPKDLYPLVQAMCVED